MNDHRVDEWFSLQASGALWDVAPFVISHHVDEIDSAFDVPTGNVGRSLELLRRIHLLCKEGHADIYAKLAIPFGATEALETDLANLDMVPILVPHEPVSIYLFSPKHFSIPNDREEYSCPYDATPWGDDVLAVYTCGRPMHYRAQQWEFSKTVWVSVIES